MKNIFSGEFNLIVDLPSKNLFFFMSETLIPWGWVSKTSVK